MFCIRSLIPQRYVFGLMGFLAVANAFSMRAILSLAITEMVVYHAKGVKEDPYSCPGVLPIRNHTGKDFDWDEETQGEILSAFYFGYVLTHIPAGILVEKYGGKHLLGGGILCTSIFTLLTPFAARQSATWLIVARFIEGLGEGTTFPAINSLMAHWVPPLERGKIGSFVYAGNTIGTVFSSSVAGFILASLDWPLVFYLFGTLGIIWYALFLILCYNDPDSHPFISNKEKLYLKSTIGSIKRNKDKAPVPWKKIATSLPLIGLTFGQLGHDWGLFMIQSDLPKYMKGVLKYSISQNGILSSLPFLIMWFAAILSGFLSDYLAKKQYLSVTNIRKLFAVIASVGPAIGVVAASYAGCERTIVVVLFTIGMAFMGFFYPSLKVNGLDLSPNYAGTLMAIVNGIGAISGIVTPLIIGIMVPNGTLLEWRKVFWIAFMVITLTSLAYVFMGSGEIQPWNDPQKLTDGAAMETIKQNGNDTQKNNNYSDSRCE